VLLVEVVLFAVMAVAVFALFTRFHTVGNTDSLLFPAAMDMGLLVLFGMGLMTAFYERFSVTAMVMLLMTVCQSFILYIFLSQLWVNIFTNPTTQSFEIRVSQVSRWYFAALACLISMSSTLGRLGLLEVFNHNLITIIFYTLTEYLVVS
jgi:hypothetical protein